MARDIITGRSTNALATSITAGLVGRLLMLAVAFPIEALFGEAASAGFSGRIDSVDPIALFVEAVVFAPLFESLIVWLIVWVMHGKFGASCLPTALMCGAIHAGMHGFALMSLSVFPTFALHGLILANWSDRRRAGTGYWTVAGAHAVQNGISLGLWALLT
ncbi:hypothetical protein EAH79_06075 [Sphingomonas koreensis]|nr:hypothetical protein EAH79_06075 [Sphingomonas koreensis]